MENLFEDLTKKIKAILVLFHEKPAIRYGGIAFYLLFLFLASGGRTWAVLLGALGILMGRMSVRSND